MKKKKNIPGTATNDGRDIVCVNRVTGLSG